MTRLPAVHVQEAPGRADITDWPLSRPPGAAPYARGAGMGRSAPEGQPNHLWQLIRGAPLFVSVIIVSGLFALGLPLVLL